jgi:hypothetical protein
MNRRQWKKQRYVHDDVKKISHSFILLFSKLNVICSITTFFLGDAKKRQ